MAELAKHLVDDAKGCSSNVISGYLRGACVKTMPIPSLLYDGVDYWFGAKPIMIEEKDNVTPYLAVQTNQDCHRAFIKQLMDYVSLNDYLSIGRLTQIRSPEMDILKDTLKQRDNDLTDAMKQHAVEMAKLMREADDCKQTLSDVNEGITHKELRHQIHSLQRDVSIANTRHTRGVDAYETLEWKYADLEKKYEQLYVSTCESKGMASIEMETGYIKQLERLQETVRKEREKTALAKKETKSSDKKKEAKEQMKAELKAAKAKTKALEKKLNESDSDESDSD